MTAARTVFRVVIIAFFAITTIPAAAAAQAGGDARAAADTARRGADGRLELIATRTDAPIRIDGVLDEAIWQRAETATGFIQAEPREGQPVSERTEVRIAFDDEHLYIAAWLFDMEPGRIVVNDIRKDFRAEDQDAFEIILDTFNDHRNGYVFRTNAEGARGDQQVANEGREVNTSWDAVWFVRTTRSPEGWTAEFAIPFRALRFTEATGGGMTWGINFSRRIRRKNEVSFWSPVPRAYNLNRVSLAGTLTGLPGAAGSRDLRIKPFAAARTLRETGGPAFKGSGDAGLDLKYGLSEGLTLDFTLNPDFAQVEVDEQQVNLTQFSQFFPEKREFFLENSGVFYVGDAARNNRVFLTPTPDEDLLLFFSRRIGLTPTGREIPILAGARVTGQAAGFVVGGLTMQTRETEGLPANNYSVVRLRRNVAAASDIGGIFMMRQATGDAFASGGTVLKPGDNFNRVYGVDANIRLPGETDWNSYVIRTATPGMTEGQYAVRTSLNHEGNYFHGKGGFMAIGEGFNDELGYYRRTGIHKWFTDIGIRPRPEALRRIGIREMHPHIVWDYITDLDGRQVGKRLHSGYTFFFDNGGFTELSYNPAYQRIEAPFRIHARSPAIPPGGYGWNELQLRVNTDPSRRVTLGFTAITGGLWTGTQKTVNFNLGVKPSYRFRANLSLQRTDASLDPPVGDFVRTIWTLRTNYSFTTHMFVDAFAQYDPDRRQFNTNIRFNLIHRPLSDLFIVFNEQRFTGPDSPVAGRSIIVKFTRMMAF